MADKYRLILQGRNFYREIAITKTTRNLVVGTDASSAVSFPGELFSEDWRLELSFLSDEMWSIGCSDNLYLTEGDDRKWTSRFLSHGDKLSVFSLTNHACLFQVAFFPDFQNETRRLTRKIDLDGVKQLMIGSSGESQLILMSRHADSGGLVLSFEKEGWRLVWENTRYGVCRNGVPVKAGELFSDTDFLWVSDYAFYFSQGAVFAEKRDDLIIHGLSFEDSLLRENYPKFTRNTRIRTVIDDSDIEILGPPTIPEKQKENWLIRMLPSFSMLITAGAMALIGGRRMIVFSVISALAAIISSLVTMIKSRKDKKEEAGKRTNQYRNYIADKRHTIEQLRAKERQELENIYISLTEDMNRIQTFSPNLFDRTADDSDFLAVRLGIGAVKATKKISYQHQEKMETEEDLALLPEQTEQLYQFISDAPVAIDLKTINAMGVTGYEEDRFEILKGMVIDLCARQYSSDVQIILIADQKTKSRVLWARFLPHVFFEETGIPAVVTEEEYRLAVFEYLYKELSEREQKSGFAGCFFRRIVVFFYEDTGFKTHPISRFVEKAKNLGVTFVFFKDQMEEIPVGCQYILKIRDQEGALLIPAEDRSGSIYLFYSRIPDRTAENLAILLAPVYTEEISLESSLTKNYSIFEMLHLLAADDLNLAERWRGSDVTHSMAAPIGISRNGIVELDISDKVHGPHGLIAGTTGSGKSEILQTFILSMATLFHPYEVGFVIIDFKGGGMASQFRDLPHLMGTITNIDDNAIDRSLRSIRAELNKRQHLFAQAEVNHIDRYIEKYQNGQVFLPLPHLIIIVDEFAELKAEKPEFMKELISAARIGRSLGVHLILATQKPAGQVSDQIWSNSRFKLCLKVQSREDSNEVLRSPLASEIREPGRAYLQVGNNEIFELFQSAYSGSLIGESSGQKEQKEFAVYRYTGNGKRVLLYQRQRSEDADKKTQLSAIVEHICGYCEKEKVRKLSDICLPELSEVIDFRLQIQLKDSAEILCPVGIYDDPDRQDQGVCSLDLSSENVMIIGSSQSGKTNLLQTMIRGLTGRYSPADVQVYIIDFASMALKNFERLCHVGGVVTASDDEKLKNLFKLLLDEIHIRKEKLLKSGVSSFSAYRETGFRDLPQILLMIDNLTALRELYLQDSDDLLTLCREGLSVGLCTVIANSQTQGIGYRYLSNFSRRIALFCNDSGEYSSLFDRCRTYPPNIPGRSLIELDKSLLVCQIYLAFQGEKEIERVNEIRHYIEQTNRQFEGLRARQIPMIPRQLTSSYIHNCFSEHMKRPYQVVAGLDYANVMPLVLNLGNLGILAVSGCEENEKYNMVRYLLRTAEKAYPGNIEVTIVDGIERKLQDLQRESFTKHYTFVADEACPMLSVIEEKLKKRYDLLSFGDSSVFTKAPLLLMLIDGSDAMISIQNDRDALGAYRNICGRYKNLNVCMLLLVENTAVTYSSPDILKTVKETRHILYFDNLINLKVFDLPLSQLRTYKKPREHGDSYYIKGNEIVKLKVPSN